MVWKVKSGTVHLKEQVSHHDNSKHNFVWHTLKEGMVVPDKLVRQALKSGYDVYDDVPKKVEKPVVGKKKGKGKSVKSEKVKDKKEVVPPSKKVNKEKSCS